MVARHSFITYFRRFSITLLLTLVFLEAGLRIEGKISSFLQERRNLLSLRQKGEYRIMCLGESTTKGQYPPYLEEILNQSNIGIKFSVIDKGVDRTNTTMILSKLESNLDTYHPDMVITMMGINNIEVDVPSEYVSDSKAINFLESFRIYKLAQLLWLHIVTRFKELKSHDASSPKLLRKINLQQAYAEDKDASPSKEPLKSNEATELKPTDDEAYFELGNSYREQGRFSEAESSFKKAIELNPRNDGAYAVLEILYIEMGKMELARKYGNEARDLRLDSYSLITAANYQKLKAVLDKKGIVYVCVQYPMRNIEPLKKLFQGNDKGIIFVDNEGIFKDEVAKYGRQDYFIDMFGGDFGHCTEKGNRLLAQNIAKVILKEVFGK